MIQQIPFFLFLAMIITIQLKWGKTTRLNYKKAYDEKPYLLFLWGATFLLAMVHALWGDWVLLIFPKGSSVVGWYLIALGLVFFSNYMYRLLLKSAS